MPIEKLPSIKAEDTIKMGWVILATRLKTIIALFGTMWRTGWTYQVVAYQNRLLSGSNKYQSPVHPAGASTPIDNRSASTVAFIRYVSDRIASDQMSVVDVGGADGRTAIEVAKLLPNELSLKWAVVEKDGFNSGVAEEAFQLQHLVVSSHSASRGPLDLERGTVDLLCFIGSLTYIPTAEVAALVKRVNPRFILVQRYALARSTRAISRRYSGVLEDIEVLLDKRELGLLFKGYRLAIEALGEPLRPEKRS